MKTLFLITSREEWTSIKRVSASFVLLSQLGDIHPYRDGPVIDAETVILDFCDKNFVYSQLNYRTFPSMKKLVLASSPCEAKIVKWLSQQDNLEVLVHENYWRYIVRWCPDAKIRAPHIKFMLPSEYENFLMDIGNSLPTSAKKD